MEDIDDGALPPPYAWDWKWTDFDGELGSDIMKMRQLASVILHTYRELHSQSDGLGFAECTKNGYGLAALTEIGALNRPEHASTLKELANVGCNEKVFSACTSNYLRGLRLLRQKIDIVYK